MISGSLCLDGFLSERLLSTPPDPVNPAHRPIIHLLQEASWGCPNPCGHPFSCSWCPGAYSPPVSPHRVWEDGHPHSAALLDGISLNVRYAHTVWPDSPVPGFYSADKLPQMLQDEWARTFTALLTVSGQQRKYGDPRTVWESGAPTLSRQKSTYNS